LIKDQLKATGGIVMANFYTDDFLRMLRNKVKIDRVIDLLMLDTRQGKDLLRFRCPVCDRFHTATNPGTNLGRCFECGKNFNPIDLVMAATRFEFIETVEFLKKHIQPES
jgi:DNA primase